MARNKKAAAETDGAEAPAKSKKKLVIVLIVVLGLAAAGYSFVGGKSGAAAAEKPVPGAVVPLEAVHINLAGGHYLKLGLALQATDAAHAAPDGSQALDIAIDLFSGQELDVLNDPAHRAEIKKELIEKVGAAYHHEVMDIYFTEFVTQ